MRLEFHNVVNMPVAVHALSMHMLTMPPSDYIYIYIYIYIPRYVNCSVELLLRQT